MRPSLRIAHWLACGLMALLSAAAGAAGPLKKASFIPLWVPQALWVTGLVWFALVLALMLIRASVAMVRGDLAAVRELCGIRSASEEASDEAAMGERLVKGDVA